MTDYLISADLDGRLYVRRIRETKDGMRADWTNNRSGARRFKSEPIAKRYASRIRNPLLVPEVEPA